MRSKLVMPPEAKVEISLSIEEAQLLRAIAHWGDGACRAARANYPGLSPKAEVMMQHLTESLRGTLQVVEGFGAYDNYK